MTPFFQGKNSVPQLGAGNDYVSAWNGADLIYGHDVGGVLTGDDYLRGDAGSDTIFGGAGADSIVGARDSDRLTGGAGRDHFVYSTDDMATPRAIDVITDFQQFSDLLVFSSIDTNASLAGDQAFAFRDSLSFSASGIAEIRWYQSGGNTFVQADMGDGVADITLQIQGLVNLLAQDFTL
ncbi:MAG: M10 family metallopeptidase C-terminal domain-containing protein [Roseomonas sp.]|nr:M10 family metallopeptidase C-terminal domain-containing protein [Roseomonas sp.]